MSAAAGIPAAGTELLAWPGGDVGQVTGRGKSLSCVWSPAPSKESPAVRGRSRQGNLGGKKGSPF
ncbi:hypothetical protein EVA_13911 [gut metagenome]|uniref:Uncharacterized protein n=1 Tax=gut metagenome TaxID=749906 RepID=J9FSP5_9ZZZZ